MCKRSNRLDALLADRQTLDGMSFKRGDVSNKARVQKGCQTEKVRDVSQKYERALPKVEPGCKIAHCYEKTGHGVGSALLILYLLCPDFSGGLHRGCEVTKVARWVGPSASSKKRGVAKLGIVLLRQDEESGILHLSHVRLHFLRR